MTEEKVHKKYINVSPYLVMSCRLTLVYFSEKDFFKTFLCSTKKKVPVHKITIIINIMILNVCNKMKIVKNIRGFATTIPNFIIV